MKRKRLDRDLKWGFQHFPYYQMRVDTEEFHGLVSLIQLVDGAFFYWDLPIAGKVPVCGKGMMWLQLVPDDKHHMITVKYLPEDTQQKTVFTHQVSLWYVDMIDRLEYDPDGVAAFVDQYLDVYFTPQGDVVVDDRDELDEAFQSGELSQEQYQAVLRECDEVIETLCRDTAATQRFCNRILEHVAARIAQGEARMHPVGKTKY